MAIIDKTYFWGQIKITGLSTNSTPNDIDTELGKYIAKLEPIYLEKMFGEDIAKNLPAELKAMLYDATAKTSPIANYVYYYWQKANASKQTNAGNKVLNVPNTIEVSPMAKAISAWNEMRDTNVKILNKLYDMKNIEIAAVGDTAAYTINFLTDIGAKINPGDSIFHFKNILGI